MRKRIWAVASRGAAALCTAALAGCFTFSPPPSTAIEASDNGVFVPTLRVSIGFGGASGAPSQPQQGHAVELGASTGSGSDTQTLSAGQQPVRFAGQTFSPPQQLQHEFDFTYFEAAYRGRAFVNDSFGIELLAGAAHAKLDLAVSSPAQRASEGIDSVGGTLGIGMILRLRPSTSVQARFSFFNSGSNTDITSAQRFELYLTQSVGRNVGLRAGYAAWKIESEREDESLSSIKVKFSGPSVGLDVMF